MSRRSYYRPSGRQQHVTPAVIKAWRRLANAAMAHAAGDLAKRQTLEAAYIATDRLPVMGHDASTNPCLCLRDAAYGILRLPVHFQRPDDLTFYAQKVAEACAHEERLNAAMKEAG